MMLLQPATCKTYRDHALTLKLAEGLGPMEPGNPSLCRFDF
jgi:hypothetical protein